MGSKEVSIFDLYVGDSSTRSWERGLSQITGNCMAGVNPSNRTGRMEIPSLQTIFAYMEHLSIRVEKILALGI